MFSHKVVSDSAISWTVHHQAPLSVGFPRQKYWVGCHFLLQGIFPSQDLNSCLLHWQADFFFFLTTEPPGKSLKLYFYLICVFICLIFAYYKLHDNSDLGFFCSWFPSLGLSWGLYKFFFINAGYMIEWKPEILRYLQLFLLGANVISLQFWHIINHFFSSIFFNLAGWAQWPSYALLTVSET